MALLLEAGADVLAGDAIGATALIMAACKGATEVQTRGLKGCTRACRPLL